MSIPRLSNLFSCQIKTFLFYSILFKSSSVTASQTQMKTKTNSQIAWGFPHATPIKTKTEVAWVSHMLHQQQSKQNKHGGNARWLWNKMVDKWDEGELTWHEMDVEQSDEKETWIQPTNRSKPTQPTANWFKRSGQFLKVNCHQILPPNFFG